MRILAAKLCLSTAIGVALAATSLAHASETTTFTYDAQGRLVASVRSGAVNNGATTAIAYDSAGNRTSYAVTGGRTTPSLAIASASVVEGGTLVFTVTRSGDASVAIAVNWATSNGTAIAGSDYNAGSGALTFAAGETSKTINVATIDDSTVEGTETMSVVLSGATGPATISTASASGTISDNDVANSPPIARPDSGSVKTCQIVLLDVLANDSDPEGQPLTLVSVTGGSGYGISTIVSNKIQFEAAGTPGSTTLTYVVRDSMGATASTTVSIGVFASNLCN